VRFKHDWMHVQRWCSWHDTPRHVPACTAAFTMLPAFAQQYSADLTRPISYGAVACKNLVLLLQAAVQRVHL